MGNIPPGVGEQPGDFSGEAGWGPGTLLALWGWVGADLTTKFSLKGQLCGLMLVVSCPMGRGLSSLWWHSWEPHPLPSNHGTPTSSTGLRGDERGCLSGQGRCSHCWGWSCRAGGTFRQTVCFGQ